MKIAVILLLCIMLCSANAGRDVRGSSTRIKGEERGNNSSRVSHRILKKKCPDGSPSKGKNGSPSKGSSGAPSKGSSGSPSKGSSGAPSKGSSGGRRRLYSSSGRQDSASKPITISQTRSTNRIVRRNKVVTSPGVTPVSAPSGLNSATEYSASASPPPTVDCPEPSPTGPSSPTEAPTPISTVRETQPSAGVTQPPATTAAPTMAPTISPGCQALEDGTVYSTNIGAVVTYRYEIQTKQGTNLTAALKTLEDKIGGYLGKEVLGCSSSRRHLKTTEQSAVLVRSSSHISNRRRLVTVGIDMSPPDTKDESDSCSDVEPGASCDVINGDFSLYLKENDPSSSKTQSAMDALNAIKTGMLNDEFVDDEIVKTHYLGADLSGIEDGGTGSGNVGGGNNGNANGAIQQIGGDSGKKLSGMGVSLIVLAVLGAIIVAFIAVRRKKETRSNVNEHYQEDESTIITRQSKANLMSMRDIDDETASTSSSYSKWRKTRSAHIYGEDDSVLSQTAGYHESILDELQELELTDAERDLVNVHHCTSATCEICAGRANAAKGTHFVASSYLDTVHEKTPKSTSMGTREYQTHDTVEF